MLFFGYNNLDLSTFPGITEMQVNKEDLCHWGNSESIASFQVFNEENEMTTNVGHK